MQLFKKLYVTLFVFLCCLVGPTKGQVALSDGSKLSPVEIDHIEAAVLRKMESFEELLNSLASESNTQDLSNIKYGAYTGPVRVFYTRDARIESDILPTSSHRGFPNSPDLLTYLHDFERHYMKNSGDIRFAERFISKPEYYQDKAVYGVILKYQSIFHGKYKDEENLIETTYDLPRQRLAYFILQKDASGWDAYIELIKFYRPGLVGSTPFHKLPTAEEYYAKYVELTTKADHYFDINEYDSAQVAYNEAFRIDIKRSSQNDISLKLSQLKLDKTARDVRKQVETTIQQYTNLIKSEPDNADLYLERGELYLEEKNYVNAKTDFQKVLELDDNYYRAKLRLASIFEEEGNLDAAIKNLEEALNLFIPKMKAYIDWEVLLRIGKLEISKGNYPAAERYLLDAEAMKKHEEIHLSLGKIYQYQRKNSLALDHFARSLEIKPEAETWYLKGTSHLESLEYEDAKSSYKRAIELSDTPYYQTEIVKKYLSLGEQFYERKQYAQAREFLKCALEFSPADNGTQTARINELLNKANLILNPPPMAPKEMADNYFQDKDYEKADSIYMGIPGNDSDIQFRRAICQFEMGRYDESAKLLNGLKREMNENADFHVLDGKLELLHYKKVQNALSAFKRAIKIDEKHVGALEGLITCYKNSFYSDFEKAEKYQQILDEIRKSE